ncbi:MAG: hypothetical protein JNK48_32455 [Bryobacterales bacterium]|nr:hypothetical protein [Bryobacterales bacterium]
MHFVLEMAARRSDGRVRLENWSQGGQLTGSKAEVQASEVQSGCWQDLLERVGRSRAAPCGTRRAVHAAFFQSRGVDRGTMTTADMMRKLRAYFHFIKKQQGRKAGFGIHPIRAVLFETTNEARGQSLMNLVNHPDMTRHSLTDPETVAVSHKEPPRLLTEYGFPAMLPMETSWNLQPSNLNS